MTDAQTRQQRRAEERRTKKQGTTPLISAAPSCTCGSAIDNPTPEQMADIRAYLHIEHGVQTVEMIHEAMRLYHTLVNVRDSIRALQAQGVEISTDEWMFEDELSRLADVAWVCPAEAKGYAALGDPATVRRERTDAENAYFDDVAAGRGHFWTTTYVDSEGVTS